MSTIIGDIPKVQHYPMSMVRYGLNPYGEPLYRVVFAPSVRHFIGGRWRDGSIEYRSRKTYSAIGNEWILERWISAEEFCGMSREKYEIRYRNETGLFTMGPYPDRGTYTMCCDHPLKIEAIQSIGALISGIEFARNNRSLDRSLKNRQAIQDDIDRKEKAEDDRILESIRERRPAFGNRPTSFRGHVHSTKTESFKHKAPFKPGGLMTSHAVPGFETLRGK